MTKRIVGLVLAGMLITLPAHASWQASGPVTNPTINQVLLEGVASADQYVNFCAFGAAGAAALFRVQHRDAANLLTLEEQYLPVVINGTGEFCVTDTNGFLMLSGERVRVIMSAGVLGTVSVSMKSNIY